MFEGVGGNIHQVVLRGQHGGDNQRQAVWGRNFQHFFMLVLVMGVGPAICVHILHDYRAEVVGRMIIHHCTAVVLDNHVGNIAIVWAHKNNGAGMAHRALTFDGQGQAQGIGF